MKAILNPRNMIFIIFLCLCAVAAFAVYRMRVESYQKIRDAAVAETGGYRMVHVPELSGRIIPGDKAPAQVFEIVRPAGTAMTIGRLITSCSCILLESGKTTFAGNERAMLTLRNVEETPGETYSMYVQILDPVKATLRRDVFARSDDFLSRRQSTGEKRATAGEGVRQRTALTSMLEQLTSAQEAPPATE